MTVRLTYFVVVTACSHAMNWYSKQVILHCANIKLENQQKYGM